jgi:hypothetical protein
MKSYRINVYEDDMSFIKKYQKQVVREGIQNILARIETDRLLELKKKLDRETSIKADETTANTDIELLTGIEFKVDNGE